MGKLTYNTKLVFSSEADIKSVLEVLSWQRLAFNECSKICYTLKKKSIIDLHSKFYKSFRESQEKIPSQIVITAERECLARYKSVKSNKHKIKKPIVKNNLSTQLDKRLYSVRKNGKLSIISSNGRVECEPYIYKRIESLWGKYKICDPLLFVRNKNEVWISLIFDTPEEILPQTKALGIDLGLRQFAVSSDGIIFDDKKFKHDKRKLRRLKRCLQRKESKGSRSAKNHLRKLKRKEVNKNKDFIHHTVNDILKSTDCDVIAVENLKGIKKKKHKNQNKNRISQVPLYEFVRVLSYKAPIYGKTVIKVDPRNTSKTDHATEKMNGKRQGRRYYSITGNVWDAEWNAAINIAKRTKLPVSFVEPYDGSLKPYRQGLVNSPNVM